MCVFFSFIAYPFQLIETGRHRYASVNQAIFGPDNGFRLSVVKPLSEPMLTYYQLNPAERISIESYLEKKFFIPEKFILKCRMQYVDHSCRPQCIDGPGIAKVHYLPKPSSVPVVIYECDIKQSMFVNKNRTDKMFIPSVSHC